MGKWYNRFYNWATGQGLGQIGATMDYHWRKYVEGLGGDSLPLLSAVSVPKVAWLAQGSGSGH